MHQYFCFKIALLVGLSLFVSCKDDGTEHINSNIVLILNANQSIIGGNFWMGVSQNDRILTAIPVRLLLVNQQLQVLQDSLLILYGPHHFLTCAQGTSKVYLVRSEFVDVSDGALLELDLQSLQTRLLRDSTFNISSAIFSAPLNSLIYYSYGNNRGLLPGYYRYRENQGQDSLVFQYFPEVSASEVVNGFDVSPDGTKLLIPINRSTLSPLVVEYTLATGHRDTLSAEFSRQLVWLRYNSLGTRILYCNYPTGVGGSRVDDDTEIGIMDRTTKVKSILDVNTNPGGLSVSLFPNWASNDAYIVYGSARGPAQEPPGAISAYSLYALRLSP